MEIKELINLLQNQEEDLQKLLICVNDQKSAIVKNNLSELQHNLLQEEYLLMNIQDNGISINSGIKSISDIHFLDLESYSITSLLASPLMINEMQKKILEALQNSIRDLVNRTTEINRQNKVLVEHSRNYIKDTVNALAALHKSNLLDRRI